ncbi:MAG: hypothetical protein CL489_05705 [Acidobacteria bacterium]|nr:hypothetical protein [Acidobacteriota bacterium]
MMQFSKLDGLEKVLFIQSLQVRQKLRLLRNGYKKKYQHGVETLGIKIEGPFSKESVVEDNLERVNSKPNLEDETNTRIQNAKDRLRAAKTSEEITRVFGSFSKDYFVLKALYDQFMAEVVPSAPGKRFLDFKKAIEDHLTKLLIPIREQLMVTLESQGIPVDDLVLTDPRVLAEVKRVLMAEEALEAKQTPKESISGRAAAETELAAIAVTEEQKAAAAEGEFVDTVDELGMDRYTTEKLEKDNFIEVLNTRDRPWKPLNVEYADLDEWQGIKNKVFEKLSIDEKVQFREVVQQNGGKRPDTFILKRLLELFELHEDKGIVYQLATSPIVVLDKALKVKKQQERLGNKIKNQILEEDIVRRFKEEGRDRRRIEVKEAYVEELNKLKNDHADTDFTRFIELFPGLAQHFGYAKEQVGYVIKYFPSSELDQVIFDPQDMYTQAEKEKRAKEKKPVLKPRLMTKKEYLKKIIQKGKVSGKGEKAESMRRNSFFTIVTPEGRRKAIQQANKVRKFVKDKGGMRAIAIEDFKKDKKDRRKRKVKKAFDLHLEDLNNRYENKLNEAYRKQEIPFDVTIVGTMASKLLGTYIEGNKNFRFENLRNLFTLAADHGYEFRARPNNPYYTNWITDMPFTKTAQLLTAGKKTSTSRTSIHGAKGDIIASKGVKGLYILTKTPYRKSAKSIVKTDFKKEGFDSPRALLDVFEELGYLKEDFGNEHINEFMTGYRGAPKYQRYVLELEMQGYTDKEIAARNREIREAHLDRLNKTFPQLMVLQEVAITEMGAAAVAVGARKKVPDRATRPRLLKNNSTVWLAPERKKAIKKQLGANFSRIMVGNHGAYFEFNSKPKIPLIKRHTRKHYNHWETKRGAKFYEQTATVNYADYKVGKWYVSVNDLQTGKKVEFKKEYQDRDLYVHEFRKLNAKEEAQYSKQSKLLPSKALSDFTMDEFDNSKAAISVAEGGAIKYTFGQLFQREIKTSFWNAKANTTYHMDAMIDSLPLVPLEKEQAIAVKTVLNEEFQEAGLAANMAPYERIVDKVKEKRLRVNFYRRIKDQVNEFLDNNFPEVSERLQAIKDTITKEGKAIKPTKIISGGQIGVDFAMLEAATESGIETGGMAPLGYRSEAQDKAAHMDKLKGYGLTESESANYMDRTRENVDNSAGTIVFTELDGLGDAKWDTAVGTNKTVEYAKEQGKPVLINPKTPEHIWLWMASNGLEGGIINMAGPRVMAPERIQDIKFIVTSAFKVDDVLPQYDKGDEYDAVTSFVELLQEPSNKNYYLTPSNEFVWATNDRDKFSMGVLYDEIHNALFYVAQHEYGLDLTSRHINEVYEGDSQGTFGEEEVQEAQAQDALEAWKIPGINDDQWQSHQRKIISEHGGSSLINSYRATPVNWTESELVTGAKQAIKKRPEVRKSSSFERVLGKYANPLINILNKFDYFGITADITFLTYDDINPDWNNSEKSKDEVLRKMKANKLRSENLDILWKERAAIKKAEGAFPRGTTFKTKGGKEYIVVIDTHAISRQPFGFESIGDVLALNRVQKKLLGKAQILITIAHELGHVVALNKLDEIHKKPGLKAKIMKDFEEAKPTNARYQGKNGFEEWYADQYASWLIAYARDGRHRAATTGTDSFFKNLAKKIIQVWSQLSEGMAEVFAGFKGKNKFKKSAAFAEWATELTKQFKGTVDFEFSRGHLNFEQKSMIYHMVEKNLEAEKQGFGLPKPIWKKVKEQTAKIQEKLILQAERNPDIKSFFARTFFTASGYLEGKKAAPVPKTNKEGEILLDDLGKPIFEEEREEVGKKIVRRLYQESRTSREAGELQPYVDAINQKFHQITSQIAKILGIDEVKLLWNTLNEEQNKAILYAEDDRLSDEELKSRSRIGWELRKLLRDFYTEYLLQEDENGNLYLDIDFYQTILRTPQGKKIVSYFPRSLNVYEILGNDELRASFIDLIVQKLDAGQLLTAVLDPETREKKTVLAVPKEGQTSHEWAVEFLNNVLELDTKELAAEGLEAASIGLSDPSSVELGMPSSLTRSLGFKVRQAVDEEGNLLVDKEGNPIYREYGFSTSELRDLGLIKDGFPALLDYFREGIKRMEYEQKVGGHIWVESMIKKLPKSDQPLARDAVRAILGKVRGPMDPLARKMNSWGLTSVIFTTLTFTVFASFPDLAGPFLRSNEFSSFLTGAESLRHYFNNKQEAIQFAIDIGAVTMDTLSSMYINAAEMDYMTPGSKKATDFFFKAIMLDQFTRFTRVFAAQMGKQFLLNLARSTDTSGRAQRNMVELHGDLTKEKILAWEESGFDFSTPEGKIMSEAIYTFVNESIIRPNAAQRPIWASNPYFALVWQLKGFFYAYGKTIVGGQYREMKNRYKEAGIQGAAVPLSMMALMVLPLTLLGLELREWTKWGLAGVLPFAERDDKYFRTDNMDWGTWLFELFDRSGMAGAFGILFPLLPGQHFGGPYETGADILGPAFGKGFDLYKHGPFDWAFWKEQIPVYYEIK